MSIIINNADKIIFMFNIVIRIGHKDNKRPLPIVMFLKKSTVDFMSIVLMQIYGINDIINYGYYS